MDVPWGLLKVNHAPSLQTGKAECTSQLSQGHQMGITRTSAIGPNVSITHLILPTALSYVFDRSVGTIRFTDSSARCIAERGFLVLEGDTSSRLCGIVLPVSVSVGWWCGKGKRSGGVMLTVMYSVTGCADRAASLTSFLRTQGMSARKMFN